jgi:iron complex outermembrane receptor protein
MRKIILFSAAMLLLHVCGQAQIIFGKISDASTNKAIPFASVQVLNSSVGTATNEEGYYEFALSEAGKYSLRVSMLGYQEQNYVFDYTGKNLEINLSLMPATELLSAVDVTALRANKFTPVANSNLSKDEIEERNEGRDVPYILKDLPSTVVSSDAGTGIGYTNLRIRGSDVSRINVTINGIPLNDPESQGVFWVNTPDIATNAQSIQVQRGVGTSTNGAGAFGASVNVKTTGLNLAPSAQVALSGGSFNTLKRNISVNSGLLDGHWNVQARLSKITSDGFIDRATADLQSYYLSAGYAGKNTSIQFIHFGGGERTYQAWWGIPEAKLNGDTAALETHIVNNGYDSTQAYNLRNAGNRTYNYYEYENQVDDYSQKHYQLHLAHNFNQKLRANVALHYTRGAGFFEEYKADEDLADYNLPDIVVNDGSGTAVISSSDLVRRRWLDNHFMGTTYSLTYTDNTLELTYGGAFNEYHGDHFGELTWMQFAGEVDKDQRYYESSSVKFDFNNYLKAQYSLNKLSLFADLQLRNVRYEASGRDNDQTLIGIDTSYLFFNPKAGVSFSLDQRNLFYASVGVAQREPTRSDFIDAPQGETPQSEYLTNIEVGHTFTTPRASLRSNVFYMRYKNQLVPNGELNDVGSVIRVNVPNSYRLGLEIEGNFRVNRWLQLGANAALSQNKILDYTYYLSAYDDNFNYLGYDTTQFESTDIAYSPALIYGTYLAISPIKEVTISLIQKSVGRQYLDNTGSADKSLDPFTVFDLRAEYTLNSVIGKSLRFNILVANLFNAQYAPNGYTYGYRVGSTTITENFYYPMAGTNFLGGITLSF